MALNLTPISWEPTGRKYEVLDEFDQSYDPPRYCWKGGVGEQQIYDGANWQPYIWDSVNNEARYSSDDLRVEFASDKQTFKKAANHICRSLKFFVQRWNGSSWVNMPHGAATRNFRQNKKIGPGGLVDEDGYAVGWLSFPDATYDLSLGFEVGRRRVARFGFRARSPVSATVRFQIVKDGIEKRPDDFQLIREGGGPRGREERVVGVRYKNFLWRWTWEEAEFRNLSVEDSTEYPGEKKGTITVGPFDINANEWLEVFPDTWGATETSDDCMGWGSAGFYNNYNGNVYVGHDSYGDEDVGWIWSNVTVPASVTANDGCQLVGSGRATWSGGSDDASLFAVDARSVTAWSGSQLPDDVTPHATEVQWNNPANGTSPEIKGLIQDRLDDDHQSGDDIGIVWLNQSASNGQTGFDAEESGTGVTLYIVYTPAGAGLTIDTSQSVELSEYTEGQLSVAGISIFENISVEENIAAEIEALIADLEINLFQPIELNESVESRANLGNITVDETITIAESIASFLSVAGISIAENITLNENLTLSMNLGAIDINETMELAEALASGVPFDVENFENITLTEFVSLLETIAPSVFENITVTEYLTLLKDIGLSEFENIEVGEAITAALQQAGLNVFDSISVEEFISILKDIGIDTVQLITISEVVSAVANLAGVDVNENITLNEVLSLFMTLAGIDTAQSINISEFVSGLLEVAGVDVSDNLTISEYVNLLSTSDLAITDAAESITILEVIDTLFSHLPLTAEENISIIESVATALTTTGIDVSDLVSTSEYTLLILSLGLIDVSENITVLEAVTALLETTGANVYESISINEFVLSILEIAGLSISESITISEFVYVTMVTVAGLMNINFQARRPGLSYSARKPYAGYSTRKPKITFN